MASSSSQDINAGAKRRGVSSSEQLLMNNILNKAVSWITTHDYHLCHPNSIQWSNQNVLCCVHGPFITIIDMKLLFDGRPLDSVLHECSNDLLSGLKGALSHIHCVSHRNPNHLDINQAKKLMIEQQQNQYTPEPQSSSNTSSSSPFLTFMDRIVPSSLDCIPSISTPVFINARWCPFPPSFFTQSGLLAAVQSNHMVTIYGIPSFTFYHGSNTVIPAQWTSMINLTKYLQPLELEANSPIAELYEHNQLILHPTCISWIDHEFKRKNKDIQHVVIGTREGFFVLFELTFNYPFNDSADNTTNHRNSVVFHVKMLEYFHCFHGAQKQKKNKRNKHMNDLVITQIESIQLKESVFIAIAFENGVCQIWKQQTNDLNTFECIKQIDLQSNGSISCLKWKLKKSVTEKHSAYLAIAKHRFIYLLEIRIPHRRILFNKYSSSDWMNDKTASLFPKMGIVGIEFIEINNEPILLSSSYCGTCNAWRIPFVSPIIHKTQLMKLEHDIQHIKDNKLKKIWKNSSDIYDILMIDICSKLRDKIETEITQMTSFGIACDPNGILIALIHPLTKESKTRLSQGLQTVHLYPVSVDYNTVYHKIQECVSEEGYLYPTSIAIALDYFVPYHANMMQTFCSYYEHEFGHLFAIKQDEDEDGNENEDMSITTNNKQRVELDINEIIEHEDSLRYCLLMMRYFVSRMHPFDGMHDNATLQWLDANIASIMEVLLQLHCYKTFSTFIDCVHDLQDAENGDEDEDIDMKEDSDFIWSPDEDTDTKQQKYLSIYLMFIWILFSYLSNKNKNRITVIFDFLLRLLLIKLEDIFDMLNDTNFCAKCVNVHKCLYPEDDDDDDDEESDDEETSQFTMNCKKIEECPICRKLTSVVMHNGPCGCDGDTERHMISRCCVSFKIIANCHQLYCSCCNGGITVQMTQQLMKYMSKPNMNDVMLRSFHHCKPFVCSICGVSLVQLL